MKVYTKEIVVSTQSRFQLIDLTSQVEAAVAESGVTRGFCLVFAPHATAAIISNEHERGLLEDIVEILKEIFKPGKRWRHNIIDNNAHAHLASALIGASRVFPVLGGRLVRGTWQNVFLVEMDGPRSRRRVLVEIMGEERGT